MQAIVFCGIQATGKSTFFKEKFFKTHIRISLDLLRTRNREDQFLAVCLKTQQPFVVDNTNPSKAERAKYISLAQNHKFRVIGYYFQSKLEVALQRNSQREGKEKIPEVGVKGAFNRLEIPNFEEGFDELYYVTIEENKFVINDWKNEI
jgi:predicted kinase